MTALRQFMESGVDDLPTVHKRFLSWTQNRRKDDYEWVLTWVYAWTRRYFLRKFVDRSIVSTADAEKLMEEVFFLVHEKHGTVRDPASFASWVSVICKYRFLNYVRSSHRAAADDTIADTLASGEDVEAETIQHIDVQKVFENILFNHLDHLPEYVRGVIHRKIWEDKSYEEIGREMGYSVETVRSYFARGIRLLREQTDVMAIKDMK